MADRKSLTQGEAEPWLVEDLGGYIQLYSDGSVVRSKDEPFVPLPPLQHPSHDLDLISHKDVVFDAEKGVWARIYLPPQSTPNQRFPLIIYFHGSGFCWLSVATPIFHHYCLTWASDQGAIIVSVNYRLAPEHRLPAAYDDSIAALTWLHSQSTGQHQTDTDPWLGSYADYSNVFVAGDSAGGNIAHHLGMWAANPSNDTLRIKGMILLFPAFGGEERTDSEICGGGEGLFTLDMSDTLWRLVLPTGSNRDHPYCNPLSALPRSHEFGVGSVELRLPPMLFVIAGRDILSDRQLEYCEVLKKSGEHKVKMHVFAEEDHDFCVMNTEHPNSAKVVQSILDFIRDKCCS